MDSGLSVMTAIVAQNHYLWYSRALIMPPASKPRLHALDLIRVRIRFADGGALRLEAVAEYGPLHVPLMSLAGEHDSMVDSQGRVQEADRDWDVEGEVRVLLAHAYPLVPTDASHLFYGPADVLYTFSADVLP